MVESKGWTGEHGVFQAAQNGSGAGQRAEQASRAGHRVSADELGNAGVWGRDVSHTSITPSPLSPMGYSTALQETLYTAEQLGKQREGGKDVGRVGILAPHCCRGGSEVKGQNDSAAMH